MRFLTAGGGGASEGWVTPSRDAPANGGYPRSGAARSGSLGGSGPSHSLPFRDMQRRGGWREPGLCPRFGGPVAEEPGPERGRGNLETANDQRISARPWRRPRGASGSRVPSRRRSAEHPPRSARPRAATAHPNRSIALLSRARVRAPLARDPFARSVSAADRRSGQSESDNAGSPGSTDETVPGGALPALPTAPGWDRSGGQAAVLPRGLPSPFPATAFRRAPVSRGMIGK